MQLIEELARTLPQLRIIVFSGLANAEEAARETKRRGAAQFVSKGCDFNVLLTALRSSAPTGSVA
jgi:DNA-binding NarL/FixJ family response regulator